MLLVATVLVSVARVHAGPSADGVPSPVDTLGLSYADRAEVEAAGAVGARVDLTYGYRPLRVFVDDSRKMAIDHRAALRLWLDVGLFRKRLMLSLSAGGSYQHYTPVGQSVIETNGRSNGYDIGSEDIRLMFKGLAVDHRIVGFAIAAGVNFATGDKRGLRSDGAYGADLRFILDIHTRIVSFVAGLGFRLHGEYNIVNYVANAPDPEVRAQAGPELTYSAAFVLTPHRWVLLAAELAGSETMAPGILAEARTTQIMGTVRLRPRNSVEIGFSAGTSLAGNDSLRPEQARALLSVVWHPLAPKRSQDVGGTGDRDKDGILDGNDNCPNEPEDRDGYEDEDGCPDPDNDGDGVPDGQDRCPNLAEDRDGFEDSDGCPELDNDRDGVPDTQDRCPNEPEPRDQYFDGDGCPNNDVDGDGIPNDKDACPNAAETKNGFQDEDGCPDTAPDANAPVVTPLSDQQRSGQVGFSLRSAVVDTDGAKDLVKVIEYLKTHARATVELEGRSDRREPARLGGERAKNVRNFLIGLGISGERVVIQPGKARKGGPSGESSVDWRIVEK